MEMLHHSSLRAAPRARSRSFAPATNAADPRWHLLGLVQKTKDRLGISDREISVLRGLLTLVAASDWGKEMIVFASNRVVAERSGAVEERTLRRRILRLESAGLIQRRLSPNGKRYRIKDETGSPALTFGIDLSPLAELADHLEALAETLRLEALRITVLKAKIRQALFVRSEAGDDPEVSSARAALRRKLNVEAFEAVLASLIGSQPASPDSSDAAEMTVKDSQNVRHIQKSDKDIDDIDTGEIKTTTAPTDLHGTTLSVDECLTAASTAAEFAFEPIQNWRDLSRFAFGLAPAIGLDVASIEGAKRALGEYGTTLAILGLTQSITRINKPSAYLASLSAKATEGSMDFGRMFRSLTASPRLMQ